MAGEMAGEKKTATPGIAFCVVCDRELPGYWRDDLDGCFYCREHADIQPATQAADEPRAIVRAFALAMEAELARALAKHGPMHSHHEAYAVLLEELDEVWDEVKRQQPDPQRIIAELVQVAAMCARWAEDVCGALPPTDARGR